MKKIFKILLSFVLVFALLTPITCFAVELAEAGADEVTYQTIFTRIWEFVEANKTEVVSAAGSGLIIIVNAIIKSANSKGTKEVKELLHVIKGDASGTANAQSSVINAVNNLISGYNGLQSGYDEMRTAYEAYQSVEDDRNRLIGAVMVQNTALLEILSSVYVHNKNLPQGVKDLVVLKYANAQKALGDDAILKAIVDSVREKINHEEYIQEGDTEVASKEPEV